MEGKKEWSFDSVLIPPRTSKEQEAGEFLVQPAINVIICRRCIPTTSFE